MIERHQAAMQEAGAELDLLDAGALRARAPWLHARDGPALWAPELGVIAADATVVALHELATKAGVAISQRAGADQIVLDGDGIVVGDVRQDAAS